MYTCSFTSMISTTVLRVLALLNIAGWARRLERSYAYWVGLAPPRRSLPRKRYDILYILSFYSVYSRENSMINSHESVWGKRSTLTALLGLKGLPGYALEEGRQSLKHGRSVSHYITSLATTLIHTQKIKQNLIRTLGNCPEQVWRHSSRK